MKKIVLILDGIVAKKFLDTIQQKYFSYNNYIIITPNSDLIPKTVLSNFFYHHFDPTSVFKMTQVLDSEILDAFILMENIEEKKVVYNILRNFSREMRIIVDVKDEAESEFFCNEKTSLINESSLISGALISRLPNVPLIPQDFGLGIGEVMEINIPFGSVFAYRHVGSIQQKNYRIVGIYRQNDFILSNYSLVIQPADTILVAGNPNVLRNIYYQVKNDIGQFPAPFGRDFYVYVDMILQDKEALMRDINQALFLHHHLKNAKLFIVVLHPSDLDLIQEIKSYDNGKDIDVVLDYQRSDFVQRLKVDLKQRIGMVIVGRELFASRRVRKALLSSSIPIFKTSSRKIDEISESIVVLNEKMAKGENITSIIFDISIQMQLHMIVYDFDPDSHFQESVVQEYQNFSRIFDKKIQITQTHNKNPIVFLRNQEKPLLHFLPFESCIAGRNIFSFFSTQVEKISITFDDHPQILVPVLEG